MHDCAPSLKTKSCAIRRIWNTNSCTEYAWQLGEIPTSTGQKQRTVVEYRGDPSLMASRRVPRTVGLQAVFQGQRNPAMEGWAQPVPLDAPRLVISVSFQASTTALEGLS